MHQISSENGKFGNKIQDVLEIRYVRNISEYQNYIIAKWKKLQAD